VLVELRLENYAVIDNVAVEFASGLNLLTGETGAGKSILIDALALLLGEKASSDVIRTGTDRAVISAVFEAEGSAKNRYAPRLRPMESMSLTTAHSYCAARLRLGQGPCVRQQSAGTVAVLRNWRRIWPRSTRRTNPFWHSMVPRDYRCSMRLRAVRRAVSDGFAAGRESGTTSTTSSAMSRIVCV